MSALPTVVCSGGSGADTLRDTLASTGSEQAVCTVASPEEYAACAGLARAIPLDPWPGPLDALRAAAEAAHGDPIAIVAAGTRLRVGALRRSAEMLRAGAGMVILTRTRRQARALRTKLALHPRATLAPGSGIVLGGAAAAALRAHGWFDLETTLSVRDVARLAGPIRVMSGALRRPARHPQRLTVTVLIAAYNEEAWIGHTLRSLHEQSRKPDRIVVVDDGSSDRTGDIARSLGAYVLRPPRKQGQKATALNYGLARVDTDIVVTLDADTLFHRDAIRHLAAAVENGADATCGSVLPLIERGIWARGRAIEYSVAMRVHKKIQRGLGSVFVLSGCISAFRTRAIREIGGFSERTITDDVDATWSLLTRRYNVTYTPRAVSYTVEPPSWPIYKAQMRRWAGALFQTLPYHVKHLHKKPSLALIVAAAMWDVVTVPLFIVATAVMLALGHPLSGAIGLWALGAVVLSLVAATSVIGLRRTLLAFPASMLMLWTNLYFFVEALGREWILGRRSLAWVKGH